MSDSLINTTSHRAPALRCLTYPHPVQSAVIADRYIARSKVPRELCELPVGFTPVLLSPVGRPAKLRCWEFVKELLLLEKNEPSAVLLNVCFSSPPMRLWHSQVLRQRLRVWRCMTWCRIPNIPVSFFCFFFSFWEHSPPPDMWEHGNANVLVSCTNAQSDCTVETLLSVVLLLNVHTCLNIQCSTNRCR